MFSEFGVKFFLVLISSCFAAGIITQDTGMTMTIPLNKTTTSDNKEIYGDFMRLNGSTTVQVNFENIGANLSFVVFQVHSQYHNITLYQNVESRATKVTGTNIGLVSVIRDTQNNLLKPDTFYIQNLNLNTTVLIYISVHGYNSTDPIPGGCNMEFPINITSYMMVRTNRNYITVDAAPASIDPSCTAVNFANVTFYMMYLPEQNFYEDDYFSGIRRMMTLDNIVTYGSEIPMTYLPMRRLLSTYSGIGVVFVAVARTMSGLNLTPGYSIYVPNHSYGCEKADENGCAFSDDMLAELFCTTLFFFGLFLSFFGHRFFKTEMFLAGFFSGFLISYVLINILDLEIDLSALVFASALSGLFFGAIWLLFWWLYGFPVIAVLLPVLNFGFLVSSILYYRLPVDVLYLQHDFNFWSLFIMVMCVTAVAMVPVTYSANIISCAVLGGFGTTYAFDYFMGSSLRYILINTLRRAVVPMFNKVVLAPPFQWRDLVVTLSWILVAWLGWTFQMWHNYGRPPFPPPPRNTREAAPDSFSSYGAVSSPTRPARNPSTNPYLTISPAGPGNVNERSPLIRVS